MDDKKLQPDEAVQKLLISTPTRLVGEYQDGDLLITHCWQMGPDLHRSIQEGPYSQSYYVVVVRTEPVKGDKIVLPNYAHVGELAASLLSVLFGKRFDSHGVLESIGHFQLPTNVVRGPLHYSHLPPFNHKPRKSNPVELNLGQVSKIRPLFQDDSEKADIRRMLYAAARFYSRSLVLWDDQPELAFLDLITCGEIISNAVSLTERERYDPDLLEVLKNVETETRDGKKNADFLKARLFQVRRHFVKGLTGLLDDAFYSHHEAMHEWAAFKKTDIEERLRAAYDLRSKYVHTGAEFGDWVASVGSEFNDVSLGKCVMKDSSLKKLLDGAPTLFGLERILRHCIIAIAKQHGLYQEK
ncbi:MAG TPA: hypothetical protein VL486_03780 [Verrucomicrobiae bacterium]|nr:hypothetical protein [Verrucomicrobiae bacterium]